DRQIDVRHIDPDDIVFRHLVFPRFFSESKSGNLFRFFPEGKARTRIPRRPPPGEIPVRAKAFPVSL
ncbi:MAG: hypothetical protein J5849_05840, partial [Clostridia bacterium]|nr:hypothetical protein [Clostridia bacterium]